MSPIGRFVAGVGAIALGLATLFGYWTILHVAWPDTSPGLGWVVLGSAIFGVTTSAFYTWTVDGPFVLARHDKGRVKTNR